MTQTVRFLLEQQVELLFHGRFGDMLPCFDLPLAVQVGAEMHVLSNPVQFGAAMQGHRDALLASGVTALTVRMTAVELPRRGRFRVWADFDHHRSNGVDKSADQIIVYCRQGPTDIKIELLHCTRLALLVETQPTRARLA